MTINNYIIKIITINVFRNIFCHVTSKFLGTICLVNVARL